jgi:tight adherence protein C
MLIIIPILIFVFTFIAAFFILNKIINSKVIIKKRLINISNDGSYNEIENRNEKSLYEKTIKKFAENISKKLTLITPKRYLASLEKKLCLAGMYPATNKEKWILYKLISSLSISIIFIIASKIGLKLDNRQLIIVFIFMFLLVNFFTYFNLTRKITKRKHEIEKELPNAIDLITVTVEAGLSFNSAVDRFVKSTKSNLSFEFETMLKEMRLGIQKKDALKNISNRCDVSDLSTFIGSIIQAEELGVSVTNILRIQSKIIRDKRRQRAREKSMKAPIKLLFPILFFIFPTIFLILLGPVIIQLMGL